MNNEFEWVAPPGGGWLFRRYHNGTLAFPDGKPLYLEFLIPKGMAPTHPPFIFGQRVLLKNGAIGSVYDIRLGRDGKFCYRITGEPCMIDACEIICRYCQE